ncbi:MAG: sigma-70 family RNA polymerase sigma factor [Bacilli bacterium]|nr:sigma-70 family RNA polymerase sigma factor [Bacilli bacterium]
MNLEEMNDYELISYINEHNEEANNILIAKYEPLIKKIASKMIKYCSGSGLEINDLVQEGRIGLNHAVSYFNEQKNITFYTYAKTCIERKMISTVIATKRQKNRILNESVSYDVDSEDSNFERVLKDETSNPEKIIMDLVVREKLIERIKMCLTDFEIEVFDLLISGFTYREIAGILNKDDKQIDNAIQRIKMKVKNLNSEVK